VVFRRPAGTFQEASTVLASGDNQPGRADLSPAQRSVLVELCRPFADTATFARPATNPEIAAALVLSLDAVKSQMRTLFTKFAVDDLPQNEKRLRLAERALTTGVVAPSDLREPSSG
jgi:DNA-binding NarL/FixJ family response regulator